MFGNTNLSNQPYPNKRKRRQEIRRKMGAAILHSGSDLSGLQMNKPFASSNNPTSNLFQQCPSMLNQLNSNQSIKDEKPFPMESHQSVGNEKQIPVKSCQSTNNQKPRKGKRFKSAKYKQPPPNKKRKSNKKSFPVEPFRKLQCNIKIEPKGRFPELIIMNLHEGTKILTGLKLLQKCFAESPYGPMQVDTIDQGSYFKTKLLCNGMCIAEGEGKRKLEAENKAVYSLLKKLRSTNYFIEVRVGYFPKQKYKFPEHIINPDPLQSHIYKVVCLKKQKGPSFKYPLSGPVHYVSSEPELYDYIKNHGKSGSRADLFILNIDKTKAKELGGVCRNSNLLWRLLVASSNRGAIASRAVNPKELLLELARLGGENIKYRLLLPGQDMNEGIKIEDSDSGGEINNFDTQEHPQATISTTQDEKIPPQQNNNFQYPKDESFTSHNSGAVSSNTLAPNKRGNSFKDPETSDHPQNSRSFPTENSTTFFSVKTEAPDSATLLPQTPESCLPKTLNSQNNKKMSFVKEEEIEIDPWIQENLILMDVFNYRSELHTPTDILYQAVASCPNLKKFIIEEKKIDTETGCIWAEALIGSKVVGRGTGFKLHQAKKEAARDALDNLKKCCMYIEVKKSYVGAIGVIPEFLRDKQIGYEDNFCKIAEANRFYNKDPRFLVNVFKSSRFEDFFFLDDFSPKLRREIFLAAKNKLDTIISLRPSVRKFGKGYICLSKTIKPDAVYREFQRQNITENEKYKIISPSGRLNLRLARSQTHDTLVASQQQSTQSEPEIKNEFDVPLKSSIPIATESQIFVSNQSLYSEQAKVENGLDKPYNIEPNTFRRQVKTEQNLPENLASSSQKLNADNRESRDLMGKSTSWNRSDQLFIEDEEHFRHKRQRYATEHTDTDNHAALLRYQAQSELKDSGVRTNFRDASDFSYSTNRVSSTPKEMKQNACRLDGREYSEDEPMRKRLCEMTRDEPASRRRADYDERRSERREREPDRNEFSRDYHDSEGSSNSRSRKHDISDDYQRRPDDGYNRVRTREDDVSVNFLRRSDDSYKRVRSREDDVSVNFQRRSDDGYNRVRSRERDISGDFQRRSGNDYYRGRKQQEGASSSYHRRSVEREVISREPNRVENVGSYNRQTERFWTRDIKGLYDHRY